MDTEHLLIDQPAPGVSRITLNRPEKRNAINNAMRGELISALQAADADGGIRVAILRGAGDCFSSGYDLKSDLNADQPYYTPDTGMQWCKHVSAGWLSLWDLSIPVIAQVHGYAMAGGLELVGACDLAYAAEDAALSHPLVKFAGLPDFAWFPHSLSTRDAMELHLTGRVYSGREAADIKLVNRAFPADDLEREVLAIASGIADINPAVTAVNKRYVHMVQEARGAHSQIRTAADLQAGPHMQALALDAESISAAVKGDGKGA